MGEYFLGLDIGTSSVKAVLFDEGGFALAGRSVECALETGADGRADVDPEEVFRAVLQCVKACLDGREDSRAKLCAMGLSCHMHSLLAVDGRGEPLSKVSTWADTRAGKQAAWLTGRYDAQELYQRTGCCVRHPFYPLSKVLWLRENEPEVWGKTAKLITLKEYVLHKLFGEYVVDYTLASSQGYFNLHSQRWDEDITAGILELSRGVLSEPVPCTHLLQGMGEEYASLMGVDRMLPVAVGSGDGILANLGCGVMDSHALSSTIGTSGAVRTAVRAPLLDPHSRTWCYSFSGDMWVAGGAMNNGGLVLSHLGDTFPELFEGEAREAGCTLPELFGRYAGEIPPGSEGLIFLPCFTGERSPDWNADARGLIYGMGMGHGKKHLVKAAMEGVIYRLYSIYLAMREVNGQEVRSIRANGGYIRSLPWMQIQADVFGAEITVPKVKEASALGAAYTAMLAVGKVSDLRQGLPAMGPERTIPPNLRNHEIYRECYARAQEIYGRVYPETKLS